MDNPTPQQEKAFNRAIARAFAITGIVLIGVCGVGLLFWSLREVIPFSWAIALFCIGGAAWLFGASSLMEVVLPEDEKPSD
jgi:protein-S-isoprenylcysteine O-methyltransferase Ste14